MSEKKEDIEIYETTKRNESFVEFVKYLVNLGLYGSPVAAERARIKELCELKRNTEGGTE